MGRIYLAEFLTLKDFSPEEIDYLLDLSGKLKEKKAKRELLDGENIALLFEKTLQGPIAFAVGHDEGECEFLGRMISSWEKKESRIRRGTGRIFDGLNTGI